MIVNFCFRVCWGSGDGNLRREENETQQAKLESSFFRALSAPSCQLTNVQLQLFKPKKGEENILFLLSYLRLLRITATATIATTMTAAATATRVVVMLSVAGGGA